ncbi:aromatic amino acid transport family protein, partial [Francisella tularensis]|uniref:aromatic amino acid transport family protein n=1 Tax=Francisella tularensis TaxID=263 RepID=UPI002381BCDA
VILLYSLVAAYTFGGGSLISTTLINLGITLSEKTTGIIFIIILGVFISISTRIGEPIKKIMVSGTLLACLLLIAVL